MTTPSSTSQELKGLYNRIEIIKPLLDYDEAFKLNETPLGGDNYDIKTVKPVLTVARQAGALERVTRVDTECDNSRVWKYRWDEDARQRLLEYLDNMDTLPCDCRIHIPDSRNDPDGVISCKHCGREYPAAFFRALVEDQL